LPKIHLHYPEGAFNATTLNSLAEELTSIGLECERLPDTPFVRSTVWIYAREYASNRVFVGGAPGRTQVISIEVNVFEGGLSDAAKQVLIERFTAAVGKHTGLSSGERCPVYVLIRESSPSNWGIFGDRITLDQLRHPAVDALPV